MAVTFNREQLRFPVKQTLIWDEKREDGAFRDSCTAVRSALRPNKAKQRIKSSMIVHHNLFKVIPLNAPDIFFFYGVMMAVAVTRQIDLTQKHVRPQNG